MADEEPLAGHLCRSRCIAVLRGVIGWGRKDIAETRASAKTDPRSRFRRGPQVIRATIAILCGVSLLVLAGCDDNRVQEKPPAPRQLQTGADPIHETGKHSEATVAKPQPQEYREYIGFWLAYGLYHSTDAPIHLSLIEPLGLFGAIAEPDPNWNSAEYEVDSQHELFLPLNFDLARALLGRDMVLGERVFLHDCQREKYHSSQERQSCDEREAEQQSEGSLADLWR